MPHSAAGQTISWRSAALAGNDGTADRQRAEALEEKLAHLIRAVDDLSEVVARQDREITMLTRRVQMLMEREAEREMMAGEAPAANQPPPHW